MSDLRPAILRDVKQRISEIGPLVDELAKLHLIRDVLAAPPPRPSTSTDGRSAPRQRARRGENSDAILRVVAERPGLSAVEIAEATGIKRDTVHSTVSYMISKKRLRRGDGGGIYLPS